MKDIYSRVFALIIFPLIIAASVRGQSPFELAKGVSGMTPVEYHELFLEAQLAFDTRDFAAAAAAYAKLTKSYPHNGESWFRHGGSPYELKQFTELAFKR